LAGILRSGLHVHGDDRADRVAPRRDAAVALQIAITGRLVIIVVAVFQIGPAGICHQRFIIVGWLSVVVERCALIIIMVIIVGSALAIFGSAFARLSLGGRLAVLAATPASTASATPVTFGRLALFGGRA
jgi:hypothetical protein